ncbi:sodium:neurotransmitter symporter family domain-containing protein [Ditylenchus destructor]|nr:sodium:neurotransmitter symporter family domain-containing protein [Ditylenchus destructor]
MTIPTISKHRNGSWDVPKNPQVWETGNHENSESTSNSGATFHSGDVVYVGDDESRGQWNRPLDFLMSMIAYVVGLGNVWRFPYLCYRNGGGTFLVAYIIFLVFSAVPIFFLEVSLGQYLQRGAMEIWQMCPLFKGVGIGNVVLCFMCVWYFCIIVSWAVFYFFSSMASTFPWETCNNWWNTESCVAISLHDNLNTSSSLNVSRILQTSVEQFWERRVLRDTGDILNFGGVQWELLIINVFVWIIIYFCIWKGITHAQKFVYVCSVFPYVIITVLLARGLTLPGAMTGISYYLTPNVTKLYEVSVWIDAGSQVCYSYGIGFGTLIALGSRNKFHHNCYRDAIYMCFVNGGTSLLAGFAIFSVLGFMAESVGKDISQIVKPGVGLAFLAYPEIASHLPLKQLWACLFFLMIIILGFDSQICMVEGLFLALEDRFPLVLRKHKKISVGIMCLIFCIISFPMTTYTGANWLTLIDGYGPSGYALSFLVAFEIIGIAWGFGAERMREAMHQMLGFWPCRFWLILWKFTAPIFCTALFILCCVFYTPLKYPDGRPFPFWAEMFGFFLAACSIVCVPLYAMHYLFAQNLNLSFKQRLIDGVRVRKTFVVRPQISVNAT